MNFQPTGSQIWWSGMEICQISLKKWYLHLFDVTQADLNWRNQKSEKN